MFSNSSLRPHGRLPGVGWGRVRGASHVSEPKEGGLHGVPVSAVGAVTRAGTMGSHLAEGFHAVTFTDTKRTPS